jgi:hypothetical protein
MTTYNLETLTTEQLVAVLSRQIDGLVAGEIAPAEARAVTSAVNRRLAAIAAATRAAKLITDPVATPTGI